MYVFQRLCLSSFRRCPAHTYSGFSAELRAYAKRPCLPVNVVPKSTPQMILYAAELADDPRSMEDGRPERIGRLWPVEDGLRSPDDRASYGGGEPLR